MPNHAMVTYLKQPTTNASVLDLTYVCLCISNKFVGSTFCFVMCTMLSFWGS